MFITKIHRQVEKISIVQRKMTEQESSEMDLFSSSLLLILFWLIQSTYIYFYRYCGPERVKKHMHKALMIISFLTTEEF